MPLEALSKAVLEPANSFTLNTTQAIHHRGGWKSGSKTDEHRHEKRFSQECNWKKEEEEGREKDDDESSSGKGKGGGLFDLSSPFFSFYIYLHGLKQVFFLFFFVWWPPPKTRREISCRWIKRVVTGDYYWEALYYFSRCEDNSWLTSSTTPSLRSFSKLTFDIVYLLLSWIYCVMRTVQFILFFKLENIWQPRFLFF